MRDVSRSSSASGKGSLKIVLTAAGFFPHSFGGGEVYVDRVARELARRGHSPTIVALVTRQAERGPEAFTRYEHDGLPVILLGNDPAADYVERYVGDGPRRRAALKAVLDELAPDLVHANGIKAAITSVCRERGIAHVVTAHHAGIACANGVLLRGEGGPCELPMSVRTCVPCVLAGRWPRWRVGRCLGSVPRWLYASLGPVLAGRSTPSYVERGLAYPWVVERSIVARRGVLDRAEMMVAPSRAMASLLVRNGRDPETIAVVPHGIVPLRRSPLPPPGDGPLRLGYVGRLDRLKGLHVILSALERVERGDRCELHVFGSARHPWEEAYRSRAMSAYRGGARVAFHGFVRQDELAAAFAQFDLLVVPSLLPEAFGLVVLEAFSAGRPAVVSRIGALPELVRHGVDGIVVSPGDPAELARVIAGLEQDRGMVAKLAENVPSVRTVEEHVDDLLRLYERAMVRNGN